MLPAEQKRWALKVVMMKPWHYRNKGSQWCEAHLGSRAEGLRWEDEDSEDEKWKIRSVHTTATWTQIRINRGRISHQSCVCGKLSTLEKVLSSQNEGSHWEARSINEMKPIFRHTLLRAPNFKGENKMFWKHSSKKTEVICVENKCSQSMMFPVLDGKASSGVWHVEAVPILWMKGPHAGMLPFLYSVNKNP